MARNVIQTKLIVRDDQNEFNAINAFLLDIERENLVDIKYQQFTENRFSALILYTTRK
jgi:Sporulation protein Cse60